MGSVLLQPPACQTISYTEFSSDVTISGNTQAAANTIVTAPAFTPNGTEKIVVEFYAAAAQTAAGVAAQIWIDLYDNGSTAFVNQSMSQLLTPVAVALVAPVLVQREFTPSNASHTYSLRAWRQVGNGVVKGTAGGLCMPGHLWITRAV